MDKVPKAIADAFNVIKADSLKSASAFYVVLKRINGRYYVYRQAGVWDKATRRTRIKSEYLGRISERGQFIKKTLSAKNDLENAKALISEYGGEIIWHGVDSAMRHPPDIKPNIPQGESDLKILTGLSMNSRMPVSRLATICGMSEQATYNRVKSLEKRVGIRYLLEVDTEKFGFTTYLILVKFEENMPSPQELKKVLEAEPRVQLAAITKGDYDMVAYLLDENSYKAEGRLWHLMSSNALNKYKARWYLIPFGQIYSFVPLTPQFIEQVLRQKQWRRSKDTVGPLDGKLMHRELALLGELNKDAAIEFTEIDRKHGFGRGTSRYTYGAMKEDGIIVRPTISMDNIGTKYLGIIIAETTDPHQVLLTREQLLQDIIAYGKTSNKYALAGNISMPEGIMLFAPIIEEGDLDAYAAHLKARFKGTITRTFIVAGF